MTTREVLGIADFRRVWLAQVVSFFGNALTTMGLLLLVQRALGDAASTAGVLIANALPFLVVGLVAGVWVDRWDRKIVMIWSDLARAALVLLIPVVGSDPLWLLYALVFVHASVGTFFAPARTALVPKIVPPEGLAAANGLGEASRPVAMVVGTGVAGLFVGLFDGFVAVFMLDALTFLVSAAFVARVRTPGASEGGHERGIAAVVTELQAGFRTIVRSRTLLGVLVGGAVAMFGLGATNAIMVPFVVGDLGISETWFGLLEASQTLGLVVAGASVGWLTGRFGSRRLVWMGLAAVGALVASISTVGGIAALCGLMLGVGLSASPVTASISTLLQTEAPSNLLGRVSASLNAVVTASSVGSMALAAGLAAAVGVRAVFVVSGAVAVLAAIGAALLFRGTGRPLGHTTQPAASSPPPAP